MVDSDLNIFKNQLLTYFFCYLLICPNKAINVGFIYFIKAFDKCDYAVIALGPNNIKY